MFLIRKYNYLPINVSRIFHAYLQDIKLFSQYQYSICRAAAYSKLNDFQNAIKDCEKAIEIDPKYAKAYGRMGYNYIKIFINKLLFSFSV